MRLLIMALSSLPRITFNKFDGESREIKFRLDPTFNSYLDTSHHCNFYI